MKSVYPSPMGSGGGFSFYSVIVPMRLIRLLKRDLAQESSEWVEEGIISKEQAISICNRYGINYDQSENQNIAYHVLVSLGIIFIGLSLITLIGANWDEIPRALRMWGLIIITALVQMLGLKKYRENRIYAAISLFLLGNILYGSSIILIAQIYHLGEHMPDGIFWWALGSLPIALLVRSSWLTLFSSLLAVIWFFLETNMGFYPSLFPIFIIASLFILIREKTNSLLFLVTIGNIGLWINYSLSFLWQQNLHFRFYPENLMISTALFILVYGLSHYLFAQDNNKSKDYGSLLAIWSLRFGLIFMLTMSFESPWEYLIKASWTHLMFTSFLVLLFLFLAIVMIVKSYRIQPLLAIIALYAVSFISVIAFDKSYQALYLQIIYNIALIGMGIWLIIRGIRSGISHYFFLGITAILITAFVRYLDLIGDYIGGAILFAFFAALLLGAAQYWKRHFKVEATA